MKIRNCVREGCPNTFEVTNKPANRKFCSDECKAKHHRAIYTSAESRRRAELRDKMQCVICGNPLRKSVSNAKYCSNKCRNRADHRRRYSSKKGADFVPTYKASHMRISAKRGAASDYKCVKCGKKAKQWAYDHRDPDELFSPGEGPYSTNPDFYVPMCVKCHALFDYQYRAWQEFESLLNEATEEYLIHGLEPIGI